MYKHDVLVVQFPKPSELWFKKLKTGTPVKFSWKQGRVKSTFFGYVHSVTKKDVAGQRLKVMEISFIGSSFRLKDKSTTTFKNKTIPEVAKWIAQKHGLHFVGDSDSRRFHHLSISGQSYWEWLHVNAERIGFAMFVDGATLVFRSMDKLLNSTANNAPKFSMFDTAMQMGTQVFDRTLDSLEVISGDYVETGKNNRTVKTVGGVNPVTSTPLVVTESPSTVGQNLRSGDSPVFFTEHQTDSVANNIIAAKDAAKGAAALARFTLPATAAGQGDPRVRPFLPILIEGTGTVTDGYWVVTSAHHMMHRGGEYQIVMELATDGVGENVANPFRSGDGATPGIVNTEPNVDGTMDTTVNTTVDVALDGQLNPWLEDSQGFGASPIYWKASYGGREGCCP
jgi:phage protein D